MKEERPPVSIAKFIEAIERLRAGGPHDGPFKQYRSQKEHWLRWLGEYHTAGHYGRKRVVDDARYAYNHIVEPKMLLWLIAAVGVDRRRVGSAKRAIGALQGEYLTRQAAAVRREAPWHVVFDCFWPQAGGPLTLR